MILGIYFFRRACTSIVALDKNNMIIHGRNLDYDVPTLLKPLTFQADFRKDGKVGGYISYSVVKCF